MSAHAPDLSPTHGQRIGILTRHLHPTGDFLDDHFVDGVIWCGIGTCDDVILGFHVVFVDTRVGCLSANPRDNSPIRGVHAPKGLARVWQHGSLVYDYSPFIVMIFLVFLSTCLSSPIFQSIIPAPYLMTATAQVLIASMMFLPFSFDFNINFNLL